tara:strand:- start:14057 stop:14428 length:372 start_codon:yes stop_codon:yes gene_type:complete
MRENPFNKYLTKEDKLQHRIISYLKYQYPKVLYTHVPNEGKRSVFERYKFKYLGAKAGVPDLLIFKPNKIYCGLAIELKVGYNKPTESQKEWLKNLKDNNWLALCLNNYEEIIETIDKYLKNV